MNKDKFVPSDESKFSLDDFIKLRTYCDIMRAMIDHTNETLNKFYDGNN